MDRGDGVPGYTGELGPWAWPAVITAVAFAVFVLTGVCWELTVAGNQGVETPFSDTLLAVHAFAIVAAGVGLLVTGFTAAYARRVDPYRR